MRGLSTREQRLVALLLLIGAIGLAWFALILPIVAGFRDRAAQRDDLLATYARDERSIGQLPSIVRAAATQRRDQARFRLAGRTEAAATAVLVERLGSSVTAVGGTLVGVENLAPASGLVRARVQIRASVPQFAAFLERLQNDPPVLLVDAVAIDANVAQGELPSGLVDARVEVSAYYSAAAPR